jgi:hypothetical protein
MKRDGDRCSVASPCSVVSQIARLRAGMVDFPHCGACAFPECLTKMDAEPWAHRLGWPATKEGRGGYGWLQRGIRRVPRQWRLAPQPPVPSPPISSVLRLGYSRPLSQISSAMILSSTTIFVGTDQDASRGSGGDNTCRAPRRKIIVFPVSEHASLYHRGGHRFVQFAKEVTKTVNTP